MSSRDLVFAAAGTGGGDATYVEDVFSTYLYTGNGSTQTITNGIDLAGEGGMVWIKNRAYAEPHVINDTERGAGYWIGSDRTNQQSLNTNYLSAFTSSGFTLGGDLAVNGSNANINRYASWTFRKQPKFFDVVTYTGDGVAGRTVAHNLGSAPGMIFVKAYGNMGALGGASEWQVYHRSLGNNYRLILNSTIEAYDIGSACWNATNPTSSVFSLGTNSGVNQDGVQYVAYLFAHDAGGFGDAGTDNVISCGSFTTPSSGSFSVNLGYEPQYVLVKSSSATGGWFIFDTMRGFSMTQANGLYANSSNAEAAYGSGMNPTATGFESSTSFWTASTTFIYMAIRRPMAVPTDATTVFGIETSSSDNHTASFTPDSAWLFYAPGYDDGLNAYPEVYARLTGKEGLQPPNTRAANTARTGTWDSMTTFGGVYGGGSWLFRRAPNFFDVVCYTGTGSARTVAHNLGVAPELMIVKSRSLVGNWAVYSSATGNGNYLLLNATDESTSTTLWNNTTPTSSVFSLAAFNSSGSTYVAYLFATCAGVSKVGSYTGTDSAQTINCGFTGGARFVMIKRTDSTGDWYVWDTARGIISGNDPYLLMNSTAAEVTSTDYIDPVSSGFEISSTAPSAINASGGSFIFLAIA